MARFIARLQRTCRGVCVALVARLRFTVCQEIARVGLFQTARGFQLSKLPALEQRAVQRGHAFLIITKGIRGFTRSSIFQINLG